MPDSNAFPPPPMPTHLRGLLDQLEETARPSGFGTAKVHLNDRQYDWLVAILRRLEPGRYADG